jgi:hypothetical protein
MFGDAVGTFVSNLKTRLAVVAQVVHFEDSTAIKWEVSAAAAIPLSCV